MPGQPHTIYTHASFGYVLGHCEAGNVTARNLAFTTNSGLKAHCVAWQTWLQSLSGANRFAVLSAPDQLLLRSSTLCIRCCGAEFVCWRWTLPRISWLATAYTHSAQV